MRRVGLTALFLFAACSEEPITIGGDGGADTGVVGPRDAAGLPDAVIAADAPAPRDADPGPLDADAPDLGPPDTGPLDATADSGVPACREPSVLPPAVCGSACGNGVRESCQVCPPDGAGGARRPPPLDAGGCITETEACDQADLAGETCAGRGFAGGRLGCTSSCTFDLAACASCEPGLGATGCREGAFDGRGNTSFDLAATRAAVAVAWVTAGPTVSAGSAVHIAILAPDLTPTDERACFTDVGQQVAIVDDGATGWLLAVADAAGLRITPLDAVGVPAGAPSTIAGASSPRFGSSPTGARTILYLAADGRLSLALLGPGGVPTTTVRPFRGPPVDADSVSVAGNGTHWFAGARISGAEVAIFDAALTALRTVVLDGTSSEYPMVSAAAGGAFVTYAEFSGPGEMRGLFLDNDGQRVRQPIALGAIPDYFNPAPTVFDGAVGHVLLAGYTGGTGLSRNLTLARVAPTGGLGATAPIARAPAMRDPRIIAIGSEAVVGWRVVDDAGEGRVAMARLPLN